MKTYENRLYKPFFIIFFFFGLSFKLSAQLPTCTGASAGYVYYCSGTNIYNYDPTLPISSSNPSLNTITAPSGTIGLSLGQNLNAASPAITFYTCGAFTSNDYYWYNGTTWVNTGFTTGNGGACNPGSAGSYIFNLNDANGDIYRYNGTASGTFLASNPGWDGPHDVQGDCAGNYYVLSCAQNKWLHEFNSSGTQINSWTLSGMSTVSSGGGMAIIGNNVYAYNSQLWKGVISGTNVSFTSVGTFNNGPIDFAACPLGGIGSLTTNRDTSFYCGTGAGVTLTSGGQGPYTWTVLNGPAVIAGSGNTVTVTSTATSLITVFDSSNNGCGSGTDTTLLVVPTAIVKAGSPDQLVACGTFNDVLHGSLTNTISWLTYNISWSPSASVVTGGSTLQPSISPVLSTTYYINVSTPATEGGCTWKDSVLITVIDTSVHANYTYNIKYGCHGDTVVFANATTRALHYKWSFGDGNIDTASNPVHIYQNQGTYNVKLYANNLICEDSNTQSVNLVHPLHASFTTDKDTICQNDQVTFTNTSATTVINGINPSYFWNYEDGFTDVTKNTVHTFTVPGIYVVMLAVKDFVPCYDTAYHIIAVDSIPFINFTMSDSVFCQGKGITFTGNYLQMGNKGIIWDFGDGANKLIYDRNPVNHAYDLSGNFTVKFSSNYAVCPDTFITQNIKINPYPVINLGPDTSMCPNAGPIAISDFINSANGTASWLWNTGETSPGIEIKSPGVYSCTVTINGCSATDSVTVNKDCYIDIPNVFSPNGDGINDYFFPRQFLTESVSTFKMEIFNRWGDLLFETSNINGRGWDGKYNDVLQPQGVYVYMIDVSFKNGVAEHFNGNITLLR